jgi:hypothetical protein
MLLFLGRWKRKVFSSTLPFLRCVFLVFFDKSGQVSQPLVAYVGCFTYKKKVFDSQKRFVAPGAVTHDAIDEYRHKNAEDAVEN